MHAAAAGGAVWACSGSINVFIGFRCGGEAIAALKGDHPGWVLGGEGARRVQSIEFRRGQSQLRRPQVLLQLGERFHPDDNAADALLVQQPGQGHLRRRGIV